MARYPRVLASGALLTAMLCARSAAAQTTTSGPTVTVSGSPYPDRIVNGTDLGFSTRPQNLNPLGVSYADCESDMQLQFSVSVSGFDGSQNMQVWASKSSYCTANQDRGIGVGTGTPCWFLYQGITAQPFNTATTLTITIPVRDIVGQQNISTPVNTIPQNLGDSACRAQLTYPAVTININFVPLDASNYNAVGTAYTYQLNTDMVGPPAPMNPGESVGNTLFNVTWTANLDTDTNGYDIFMDPPPGGTGAEPAAIVRQVMVCPDAGTSISSSGESDADLDGPAAGADATTATDAMTSSDAKATTSDAGCYYINVAGTGETADGASNACNDPVLEGAVDTGDGGEVVTTVVDDSGVVEEGGTVETSNGGISTVPTVYLVAPNNATGVTVSDKTADTYTITGLTNGVTYDVVVAAVDGYGNVGPSSNPPVCDYPAPTQDFFGTYRADGGGGGGGFCALDAAGAPTQSLAGAGLLVGVVTAMRRRKRGSR